MHTYKKQFFLLLLVTKNWVPLQYTCRDIHKIKKSIKIPIKLTFYWITKNNLSIFDNGISLYQQEITRRHSSRMPAARLLTMHVSYCTNLNMSGRGGCAARSKLNKFEHTPGEGDGSLCKGDGSRPCTQGGSGVRALYKHDWKHCLAATLLPVGNNDDETAGIALVSPRGSSVHSRVQRHSGNSPCTVLHMSFVLDQAFAFHMFECYRKISQLIQTNSTKPQYLQLYIKCTN